MGVLRQQQMSHLVSHDHSKDNTDVEPVQAGRELNLRETDVGTMYCTDSLPSDGPVQPFPFTHLLTSGTPKDDDCDVHHLMGVTSLRYSCPLQRHTSRYIDAS